MARRIVVGDVAVNVQPFLMDGKVYGLDQSGELRCIDIPRRQDQLGHPPATERTQAGQRDGLPGPGRRLEQVLEFAETGDLIIGQLSPDGFKELSRTHVIDPTNNAFGRDVVWCARLCEQADVRSQ